MLTAHTRAPSTQAFPGRATDDALSAQSLHKTSGNTIPDKTIDCLFTKRNSHLRRRFPLVLHRSGGPYLPERNDAHAFLDGVNVVCRYLCERLGFARRPVNLQLIEMIMRAQSKMDPQAVL